MHKYIHTHMRVDRHRHTHTHSPTQGILGSFDLKTVPALGTEFDYNLHEAIQVCTRVNIVCVYLETNYTPLCIPTHA